MSKGRTRPPRPARRGRGMDATPTPPTFRPLSEDERRTLVAEARKWQPDRPPDRAAYWRGEVDRNWRGTALDDERALLVVNARPSALLAAVPLFSTYVSQLAELTIDFPRSDALRAALEREEKVRAVWALEWIAETERLRGACLVKRTQAAAIASQLKGPPHRGLLGAPRGDDPSLAPNVAPAASGRRLYVVRVFRTTSGS